MSWFGEFPLELSWRAGHERVGTSPLKRRGVGFAEPPGIEAAFVVRTKPNASIGF
jgi:hypothetical protein